MITKDLELAEAIVTTRVVHPELVPFGSSIDATSKARLAVLNASEIGRCSRQVWYEKNDGPRVEGVARPGILDRGHAAESWAVAMLNGALQRTCNGGVMYAGKKQRRLVVKEARIAGTPDGLAFEKGGSSVLEVKSYGSTNDRSTSPSLAHIKQAELNVELFHRCTDHNPKGALIMYVSAEDYTAMHLYRIPRRPAVWIEALARTKQILDAERAIDVMPTTGPLCQVCPFRGACTAAELRNMPLEERVTPSHLAMLNGQVERILENQAELERLLAEQLEARATLKQTLKEIGTRRARAERWEVFFQRVDGSPQLDSDALARVLGDLRPYQKPGDDQVELIVRER